ncbi:hypothetical protein [Gloeothece verrucosa]|uniref:Uncharacterized protein n=1 Tax=Gloeothece verrucosa (strain PCC 7822) TaxID=497965 RepID=E0UAC3_GLOV7|nr:hypothetical protein [Gloeothece verrucosa]ADN17428.1 hypothetical protein Cyan7822_5556 [Gloeothece verrucosa PCC 7822]
MNESKLIPQLIEQVTRQANSLISMIEKAKSDFVEANPERIKLLEKELLEAKNKYEVLKLDAFLSLSRTLEQQLAELKSNRAKEIERIESRKDLLKGLSDVHAWKALDDVTLHRYFRNIVKDAWIEDGKLLDVDLEI